jgi:hypothetical protein
MTAQLATSSDGSPADTASPSSDPSDATLVDTAAATLAVPRSAPADSFVLHAPLELLARAALLPMVEPAGRGSARDRVRALAAAFDTWGPGVPSPEG